METIQRSTSNIDLSFEIPRNRVQSSIKYHMEAVQDLLNKNRLTKPLVERKINILRSYTVNNDNLFKDCLKELRDMLKTNYSYRTSGQASFEDQEVSYTTAMHILKLDIEALFTETDNILLQVKQVIEADHLRENSLIQQKMQLQHLYDRLISVTTRKLPDDNTLLHISDCVANISEAIKTIDLLLKKYVIGLQLSELENSSLNNEAKLEKLFELAHNEENYAVFEQFKSIYDQINKQIWVLSGSNPDSDSLDLEFTKFCSVYQEYKDKLSEDLALVESRQKIELLINNIMDLSVKLQNL